MQKTHKRYDLSVHCIRKRYCDIDGISAKALIDAICREESTVLKDDSAEYIRKIEFTQEIGKIERTIITLEEVME